MKHKHNFYYGSPRQAVKTLLAINDIITKKLGRVLDTVQELCSEGIEIVSIKLDNSDTRPVIRIAKPTPRILNLPYTRFRNRFNEPLAHVFDRGCIIEWIHR